MNNKLFIGIGGTGKSISSTIFLKHRKKELINHIIFFKDDMEESDDQIRKSDSETL